jgi:hypothetical protein
MTSKFKLDATDFDFIKQSKQEQAEKDGQKTRELDVDIINNHKADIHKVNIDNMNKRKSPRARRRDPQSVTALRESLARKLGGEKEAIVKMTEIAKEIGFTASWLQFAMKYLIERGEFNFNRYAQGSDRGMKITRGTMR